MSQQEFDKVQQQVLSYDTYEQQGMYGTTSLEKPRYRAHIEKLNPGVDCVPLINRIDSKIGTGFHLIAEEAMNNADFPVETEVKMKGMIGKYEVGGTCDIVLEEDGVKQVGDFKTMKAYPAKKALNGEDHGKFVKQLSIYSYLLRKQGFKTAPTGIIYVFVVGWTQRDKAIPRTFRIELELMNDKQVEAYVNERISLLDVPEGETPEFDCPTWLCAGYCGVRDVCPHYNNHEFKNKG